MSAHSADPTIVQCVLRCIVALTGPGSEGGIRASAPTFLSLVEDALWEHKASFTHVCAAMMCLVNLALKDGALPALEPGVRRAQAALIAFKHGHQPPFNAPPEGFLLGVLVW